MVLSQDAEHTVVIFAQNPFRLRVLPFLAQHPAQDALADERIGVVLAQSPFFDGKRLPTQLLCLPDFFFMAKYISNVAGGHQRGTMLST